MCHLRATRTLCTVWGRLACCDYPPFCLRVTDERAVPCPATDTQFLCTRSREARLRDAPSTAENSGAGKQTRHGMQKGHHREKERKHKEAMCSSQELNSKRQKDNTLKWWEDQQRGRETDRHREKHLLYIREKQKLPRPKEVVHI